MKQIALYVFILGLISSCSNHRKIKKPFYYLAESGGQKLHILGTIHDQFSLTDFPAPLHNDIKNSDVVMLEMDRFMLERAQRRNKDKKERYEEENYQKPYPKLIQRISPKAWRNISFTLYSSDAQKIISDLKVPYEVHYFHPALIMSITKKLLAQNSYQSFTSEVDTNIATMQQGNLLFDNEYCLDFEIMYFAEKLGIPVRGLDEDLDLILSATEKEFPLEKDGLNKLEDFFGETKGIESYIKLKKAYREGDEMQVLRRLSEEKVLSDQILKDRNLRWRILLQERTERKIFVAVGLAHLIEKNNLLDLLKKDGFVITRVSSQE